MSAGVTAAVGGWSSHMDHVRAPEEVSLREKEMEHDTRERKRWPEAQRQNKVVVWGDRLGAGDGEGVRGMG